MNYPCDFHYFLTVKHFQTSKTPAIMLVVSFLNIDVCQVRVNLILITIETNLECKKTEYNRK